MTYSMKQVKYSGVKDGNTSHDQAHTRTQADSEDETQGSHFIWDHSCRLSCEYEHGPTHAQVQIT
jgi:hypothetical protein